MLFSSGQDEGKEPLEAHRGALLHCLPLSPLPKLLPQLWGHRELHRFSRAAFQYGYPQDGNCIYPGNELGFLPGLPQGGKGKAWLGPPALLGLQNPNMRTVRVRCPQKQRWRLAQRRFLWEGVSELPCSLPEASANLPESSEAGMVLQSGPKLGQGSPGIYAPTVDRSQWRYDLGQGALISQGSPYSRSSKGAAPHPNQHLDSFSLHHPLTRPFRHPCSYCVMPGRGCHRLFRRHNDKCSTRWYNRNVFKVGTLGCSKDVCMCVCPHVYIMSI